MNKELAEFLKYSLPKFHEITQMEEIAKSGSDRIFYRIRLNSSNSNNAEKLNKKSESYILAVRAKNSSREAEEKNYANIMQLLYKEGINTPRFISSNSNASFILMEDLADLSLKKLCELKANFPLNEYKKAIDQIVKVHELHRDQNRLNKLRPFLQKAFDAELYAWERRYFFENYHIRKIRDNIKEYKTDNYLANLSAKFLNKSNVLIHRDFQSENIIIKTNDAYLIDFQGLRFGHSAYDIASLLYDPYVESVDDYRAEILSYYFDITKIKDRKNFLFTLKVAGIQRLMQAIGAYSFLLINKRKIKYKRFIPLATQRLKNLLINVGCSQEHLHYLDLEESYHQKL